jgi:CRISPR-associated endonuclease/helicase Cas3
VRARLAEGRPCHLVSTQVVEAGVDLDFPLVLRAVGPLDRIVQAAGRCNREGRLPEGEVVIFRPAEGSAPPGPFRTGMEQAEAMLSDRLDLHSPSVFRDYFTLLYQAVDTDSKHIQELREGFDFPEVAQRFRVISDDTVPVLVHAAWLTADTPIDLLVTEIVAGRAGRDTFRALQPYLVSLRLRQYREARRQGLIHELIPDSLGTWLGAYDNVRGIAPGQFEPDALVVI